MHTIKKILFPFILVLWGFQFGFTQNQSNSPYTRYGYGELSHSVPIELKGMGGVSIGNRSKNIINGINPASYTSVDSMTFMFDIAANGRISRFSDELNSHQTFNSNLEYLRLRFPLKKWLAVSVGLEPYSFAGYQYHQKDSIKVLQNNGTNKNLYYLEHFQGTGGLSQIYTGVSLKLFNHIALGVNAYYLFGELNNKRTLSFINSTNNPTSYSNKIVANDFRLRYGTQYFHSFGKHNVILGAIYEPKKKLDGSFSELKDNQEVETNSNFELPETIGVGLNYTFNNQFTLGIDYMKQGWKDINYFGKKDTLYSTNQFALGMEYIPNLKGRKYLERVRYRAGIKTNNQYYKIQDKSSSQNYTFSLGAGFPIFTGRSILNVAIEYGKIGNNSLLREDFIQISFSASINEYWFFKPKL
ncbi:MAG: hypothetical protein CR965_01320 [Paludibacter sp.]|nr:MAG: hypothetical protein CR965_01320 [Paludibacter sp.]